MSSETSTRSRRRRRAPAPRPGPGTSRPAAGPSSGDTDATNAMRPWHLFVIGTLAAASAGAIVSHGTRPVNVVFVCLAIFAAGGAGYALYRTLWPLVGDDGREGPEMLGGRTRAALEREKFLVLRAIKDLEFDRAMGKVSEPDFEDMIARLRVRAVRIIRQLDAGAASYHEIIERELGVRQARQAASPAGATPGERADAVGEPPPIDAGDAGEPRGTAPVESDVNTCPGCRAPNDADARFCKRCGTRLSAIA